MTLNQTPSAERIHIGIFGKRNAGKSSLINALAGQPVSIVSDFKGTTTDPVKKAMELLPLPAAPSHCGFTVLLCTRTDYPSTDSFTSRVIAS